MSLDDLVIPYECIIDLLPREDLKGLSSNGDDSVWNPTSILAVDRTVFVYCHDDELLFLINEDSSKLVLLPIRHHGRKPYSDFSYLNPSSVLRNIIQVSNYTVGDAQEDLRSKTKDIKIPQESPLSLVGDLNQTIFEYLLETMDGLGLYDPFPFRDQLRDQIEDEVTFE